MTQRRSAKEINRITSTIIESSIRIHRTVGPGILEKAYFGCLCYELGTAGLKMKAQEELPLLYQGVKIDCAYRADLIVEETVIVEVKAIEHWRRFTAASFSPTYASHTVQWDCC